MDTNNLSSYDDWVVTDVSGNIRDRSINGDFPDVYMDGAWQNEVAIPDNGWNSVYSTTTNGTIFCVEGDTIAMSAQGENKNEVLKNGVTSPDIQFCFQTYLDRAPWGSTRLYDTSAQWTVGETAVMPDTTYNGGNTLSWFYPEHGWYDLANDKHVHGFDGSSGKMPSIVVFKTEQYYQNASANWQASGSLWGALPIDD